MGKVNVYHYGSKSSGDDKMKFPLDYSIPVGEITKDNGREGIGE